MYDMFSLLAWLLVPLNIKVNYGLNVCGSGKLGRSRTFKWHGYYSPPYIREM